MQYKILILFYIFIKLDLIILYPSLICTENIKYPYKIDKGAKHFYFLDTPMNFKRSKTETKAKDKEMVNPLQ